MHFFGRLDGPIGAGNFFPRRSEINPFAEITRRVTRNRHGHRKRENKGEREESQGRIRRQRERASHIQVSRRLCQSKPANEEPRGIDIPVMRADEMHDSFFFFVKGG